jgi:alpha-tubulin suppressor-like RCC1 family protein
VRGAIESLAAGNAHTCGISGDQVLCWGNNREGQLGNGSAEGSPQPVPVQGLPTAATQAATQIVAGAVHTCVLVADGSAYCWGQNLYGQLGDGSTTHRSTAVAVTGGLRFRSIHAGGALTCGLATDGTEYCWGFNQNGQLGDGTRESRSSPTAVRG